MIAQGDLLGGKDGGIMITSVDVAPFETNELVQHDTPKQLPEKLPLL